MSAATEAFLKEVFHCRHCESLRIPFVVCQTAGRAFRFPPTIGAIENAPLLFVGINPRITDSNRYLHEDLMRDDSSSFQELARNRFHSHPYIGAQGHQQGGTHKERHYSVHVRITRQLFPSRPFESVAAVTELFFCSSVSSRGLPIQDSPCAAKYFERVLALIRPRVVFAVGRAVEDYLVKRYNSENGNTVVKWGNNNQARMIAIPHPNSRGEKISKWRWAAEIAQPYC